MKDDKLDLEYIFKRYLPDSFEREKKERISREIIGNIKSKLEKMGVEAEPMLVGSQSRGTELKNSDLDIFIVFSTKYSKKEMEDAGMEIGFEIFPEGTAKYAEHPYVSGIMEGVKVDIVPCFRVEMNRKIISSVDRTPLHTQFMKNAMNDEMRKEAILLKLFMKRQGIYGSELKTSGFSGYVCELIILKFKRFNSFIEYVSNLKGRLIIGDEDRTSKFNSPVVIIDPVDLGRNAAAAVNEGNLSILKIAAKFYNLNPCNFFFTFDEKIDRINRVERGTYMCLIRWKRPDIIDDILYPQLELSERNLKTLCETSGFHYINGYVNLDGENMEILIEMESGHLNRIEKREGPPVENQNSISFIRKYLNSDRRSRGPYVENGRVYFDLFRDETYFKDIFFKNIQKINFGHNINRLKGETIFEDRLEMISETKIYEMFLNFQRPVLPSGEYLNKN